MKEQNLNESLDDFFKEGFEDFTPTPPSSNWEKITSELEGETMDSIAKNQFEQLEIAPPPKVWNNIERKLPLSLLLRTQLNWLSRIAAMLMIFMIVLLVMDRKKSNSNSTEIADDSTEIMEQEPAPIAESEPVDFVFSIDETPNQNSAREELSLEDEKTIEDFWSDVMDEQDDFLADVDEDIIDESLKPILELPIENLEAALPKNTNNESIPSIYENEVDLSESSNISDKK